MQEVSLLTEDLSASQEGLCSMEAFSYDALKWHLNKLQIYTTKTLAEINVKLYAFSISTVQEGVYSPILN